MSQNLSTNKYTRFCTDCGVPLFVVTNSVKKRCKGCLKVWNAFKAREWYKSKDRACRTKAAKKQKTRRYEDTSYRLWVHSRRSAKSRGLEHTISKEDIIVPALCPVLKCPMYMNTPYAPTVDRIDSSKGYVPGNIQVMSWKANTMKNNATVEELKLFADWVETQYGKR